MAKTTEVETPVRRSKRFQPLVGPLGSAVVADGSVQWLGEPRHVRETVPHDILEDEREGWDSDDEGETSFYDAFARPRTGATVLSVVHDNGQRQKGKKKGKKKEPDVETFSVGDTVLVATTAEVSLLDAAGILLRTYDAPGEPNLWYGVDYVGDGTCWASAT